MPSVRCPSCDTAQHVESGSRGYTCSSCGKEWGFAVCRSCGSRFHSKPGTTTWTCPRCGLLQDASADPPPASVPEPAAPKPVTITDAELDKPQEPPGTAFPPGLGLGSDDEGPEDAFAMPVRESSGRPIWLYVVVAVLALVIAVVLFNVIFGGDDEPPADDAAPASTEEAIATMCGHVQQAQVLRDDALGAAADDLRADAKTLKEAGERRTAMQVRQLVASIEGVREALANQGDTTEPFAELQAAIENLPC
jgi:predicted RNA-binding Zn-ribbon protein involved in translation (DUF1610 family)